MKKLGFIAFFTLCAFFPVCAEEIFQLTILHTNDLHGWLQPFDYTYSNSLGLTAIRSKDYPQTKGWTIEDPIDAIVGGDSHTFIAQPYPAQDPEGQVVPIVQAGAYGVRLGKLRLTFVKDAGWRLQKIDGELIAIDDGIPEDQFVANLLADCR